MQTLWSFSFCLGFKNLLLVYLELLIRKKDSWPLVVITRHKSGSLTRVGRELQSWILLENLVLPWYWAFSTVVIDPQAVPKPRPLTITASQYRVLGSTKVFYSIVRKISSSSTQQSFCHPCALQIPITIHILVFLSPFWQMEKGCSASPPSQHANEHRSYLGQPSFRKWLFYPNLKIWVASVYYLVLPYWKGL